MQNEETIAVKEAAGRYYLETYGCQMNFSDSEIVASILNDAGYASTLSCQDADVILLNTCAIRENAEEKVRKRLKEFGILKRKNPNLMIGMLGCMAERLKTNLLEEEKLVDIVAGPDAYRSIPQLVAKVEEGHKAVNVLLSLDETYSDISPVRTSGNGITAFVSIMRGCDNMCSFCVVPFTRGRERSRDPQTITKEIEELYMMGYREVTLLGQNVDSYHWNSFGFADLLERVANISPEMRVRFTTSNPQDMKDDILEVMALYQNICKFIHLPMQSGSDRMLRMMKRGYNRFKYIDRINAIRRMIPGCGISTDIITGFCSETEQDHADTLTLMEEVKFDYAFTFKYSERPGTLAARKYKDDIPDNVKTERLEEIIELQKKHSYNSNLADIGKTFCVLAESVSKRSPDFLFGRNSQNKGIVFPKMEHKPGDFVNIKITDCTSGTLIGV